MEALVFFLILVVGNAILPLFSPWWILAPVCFLCTFPFRLGKGLGFWLAGFASGFTWLGYALWISHFNEHLLAKSLTQVLMLPHPVLLFFSVFFIPFLVGGLSALTGILFKQFITHGK
jgi:hypothetical protein